MTDYSPRRRAAMSPASPPPTQAAAPQAEPVGVMHEGFGRWFRVDQAGRKLGAAMTKDQAETCGLPKLGQRATKPAALKPASGGTGAPTPAEAPAPQSDAAPKRRRRASVGGFAMKLDAPPRPGFTRRWFNDQGNRIAQAGELGYEHVLETGLKTSSPGSRVSRLAGTKANGEPLHAFLMETPDELYAEGIAEREAVARQVDEAIRAGEGTSDGQMSQIPQNERYGHGEIRSDR